MAKNVVKPKKNAQAESCKRTGRTRHKYATLLSAVLAATQLLTGGLYIDPSAGFAAQLPDNKEIIELTNSYRTDNSLSALSENALLDKAAQSKLEDMQKNNYWAHVSPSGAQPWEFIEKTGYVYSHAGENLGRGFSTAQGVVNGWVNSPKHRDNLLNKNYTDIGVAVGTAEIEGKTSTVIVQMFGTPKLFPAQASSYSPIVMGIKSEPSFNLMTPLNNEKLPFFALWGLLFLIIIFDGVEIRRCGLHKDKKHMFEFRSALLINCFAFLLLFVNIVALA